MLFYQPQEFVNSLLLMRFGVKGFSVRDEWEIVPIELKNIMHSNCKPPLLEILFFHNDGINFTANVESITNDVYMTLLEGIVDW